MDINIECKKDGKDNEEKKNKKKKEGRKKERKKQADSKKFFKKERERESDYAIWLDCSGSIV